MDGRTTSAGTGPVAPFLDDKQYEMLFGEPRPPVDVVPTMSPSRLAFARGATTRWDRHKPTRGQLAPPPIPTLDLTTDQSRIELDIFADDRMDRPMDLVRSARVRQVIADEYAVAEAAEPTRPVRDARTRAVSLAFAFAGLTATIALWMIAIVAYY